MFGGVAVVPATWQYTVAASGHAASGYTSYHGLGISCFCVCTEQHACVDAACMCSLPSQSLTSHKLSWTVALRANVHSGLFITNRSFPTFPLLTFSYPACPSASQGGARRGPTLRECVLLHAVARLSLFPAVNNIQVSTCDQPCCVP